MRTFSNNTMHLHRRRKSPHMSISRIRAAKSRLAATITLYFGIATLPPATIVFKKYEINSNKGFDDKMTPFNLAMNKIDICGIDI